MEEQYLISWSPSSWIRDEGFLITHRELVSLYDATVQNAGSVKVEPNVTSETATRMNIHPSNDETEQQDVEEEKYVDVAVAGLPEGSETAPHDSPIQMNQAIKINKIIYISSSNTKTNAGTTETRKKQVVKPTCTTCGKTFSRPGNLTLHERHMHSGNHPYICSTCDKKFCWKYQLTNHEIRHGEKISVCKMCSKAFSKRNGLLRSRKKLFVCKTCSKAFTQNFHLFEHECIHTGEESYICETCSNSSNINSINHKSYHPRKEIDVCNWAMNVP